MSEGLELDGLDGPFKSRPFCDSVLIKLLSWWDVAVCALDLRKLRYCRTGNLLEFWIDWICISLWRKKVHLVASGLLKGRWAVVLWEHHCTMHI